MPLSLGTSNNIDQQSCNKYFPIKDIPFVSPNTSTFLAGSCGLALRNYNVNQIHTGVHSIQCRILRLS